MTDEEFKILSKKVESGKATKEELDAFLAYLNKALKEVLAEAKK